MAANAGGCYSSYSVTVSNAQGGYECLRAQAKKPKIRNENCGKIALKSAINPQ